MTTADDLMRQANTLAEKLRRARASVGPGGAPDTHELAAMEARLTGLWTAIRQARAAGDAPPPAGAEVRTRPKWDAPASRPRP